MAFVRAADTSAQGVDRRIREGLIGGYSHHRDTVRKKENTQTKLGKETYGPGTTGLGTDYCITALGRK